jgi:nucleotide-binding universal stress UspA family protein
MKLLVALDGSAPALNAVRRLIECAVQWRSAPEIHVLHVLEAGAAPAARVADAEDGGLTQASEWLEGARLPVRVHAMTGVAAETIARMADELGCGMIWMGAHGNAGARERPIGSTASKLLRLADVPVVLVR